MSYNYPNNQYAAVDPFDNKGFPLQSDPNLPYTAYTNNAYPPPGVGTRAGRRGAAGSRGTWTWVVATAVLALCCVAYFGLSIYLFLKLPPAPRNGYYAAGIYRMIGYPFSQSNSIRIGLTAAITIPSSLLSWATRRAHLLRSRRSPSGYLEPLLWCSHVAWSDSINYATSCLLFVVIVLTQAAGSSILILWERGSGRGLPSSMYYCPLPMIIHSAGLTCLSFWLLSLLGTMRRHPSTLLIDQFQIAQSGRYTAVSPQGQAQDAFEYPAAAAARRSRWRVTLGRGLTFWAILFGCIPIATFLAFPLRLIRAWSRWGMQGVDAWDTSGSSSIGLYNGAAPNDELGFCIGITFLLTAVVELFAQICEAIITRSWWEHLWSLRASLAVRPDTIVEGFGAIKARPQLVVLSLFGAVESWVISNALPIAAYSYSERNAAGVVVDIPQAMHSISVYVITGWSLVIALLVLGHVLAVLVVAYCTPVSSDGLFNFGRKWMWLRSGIRTAEMGSTWGAIDVPMGNQPGRLGFGLQVVSPPPPGRYVYHCEKSSATTVW